MVKRAFIVLIITGCVILYGVAIAKTINNMKTQDPLVLDGTETFINHE